jgi:hypothetical protein
MPAYFGDEKDREKDYEVMKRACDLTIPKDISDEQVFEMLRGALLPNYSSREGIQRYILERVKSHIKTKGIPLSELEAIISDSRGIEEARDILSGKAPIDNMLFGYIATSLSGLTANSLFPIDPGMNDEKFSKIHEQVLGRKPEPDDQTKGECAICMLLFNYGLPKKKSNK